MPEQEKRLFTRIRFDAEGHLVCGEERFPTEVIDLSLKGALVREPAGWDVAEGRPCHLELLLGDGATRILMEGTVAHREAGHVGIRCDYIDLDSISHLRQLLSLNLGDETALQRELREMVSVDSRQ